MSDDTDTDSFDWIGSNVVVHSQPATAVYLNPHGQVVVRQEGHYGPEEDAWLYFSIENVPLIARAMLEAAGYETETTYGKPLPNSEPLSGAERQRRYRNKHNGNGDANVTELPLRPVTNGQHPSEEVLHSPSV